MDPRRVVVLVRTVVTHDPPTSALARRLRSRAVVDAMRHAVTPKVAALQCVICASTFHDLEKWELRPKTK